MIWRLATILLMIVMASFCAYLVIGTLMLGFRLLVGPAHAMTASWYEAGTITASGAPFDPAKPICAHKTLPFGTVLRLRYRGRTALCVVLDRGPYVAGRHIDVSRAVASRLGMIRAGIAQIRVERLS